MLKAEKRQPRIKLNQFRKAGKLPAIVYGHGEESISILLDMTQFLKEIKKRGDGSLLDLQIDQSEPFKVLWQDYQRDPLCDTLLHIDLYRIKMGEKLTTDISLKFIGEAPAVKIGGVLLVNRDYLHVECLPQDLVSEIEVDLSVLENIHNSIKVTDIKIPEGITVLDDKDLNIAGILEVRTQEEEITKEAEVEAIEALGKEKDEEGAAGTKKEGVAEAQDKAETSESETKD